MERFTDNLVFILVALIVVGVLGFLIAWFWRGVKIGALKEDLQKCTEKLSDDDITELDEEKKIRVQSITIPDNRKNVQLVFNLDIAKNILGKKIVENDLKIIEGIGPGIERLLKNSGISSWEELANETEERLASILEEGGPMYRLHSPSTWAKQSKLVVSGKWKELKKYQDYLKGGRLT